MITKVGQIMLYVNNQDESEKFWTEKLGFVVVSKMDNGGMKWIEVAPTKDADTSIVLHNKELVAKMSPELNLGTPSLMFCTDNLEALHQKLADQGITIGEIINMPLGKVFNFCDDEKNYFAVTEK